MVYIKKTVELHTLFALCVCFYHSVGCYCRSLGLRVKSYPTWRASTMRRGKKKQIVLFKLNKLCVWRLNAEPGFIIVTVNIRCEFLLLWVFKGSSWWHSQWVHIEKVFQSILKKKKLVSFFRLHQMDSKAISCLFSGHIFHSAERYYHCLLLCLLANYHIYKPVGEFL